MASNGAANSNGTCNGGAAAPPQSPPGPVALPLTSASLSPPTRPPSVTLVATNEHNAGGEAFGEICIVVEADEHADELAAEGKAKAGGTAVFLPVADEMADALGAVLCLSCDD